MKISELVAALSKVQQLAGDVPVVLKRIEDAAESVVHSLDVHIDPLSGSAGGQVELTHGSPAPAPAVADINSSATPSVETPQA